MLKKFCCHSFLIVLLWSCGPPQNKKITSINSANKQTVQKKDTDTIPKEYPAAISPPAQSEPTPGIDKKDALPYIPDTTYQIPKKKNKKPKSAEKIIDSTIKKSASLGVSYFPKMKQEETKDLSVYVDISHPEAELKEEIKKIENKENEWVQKKDTSNILTTQIDIYKSLSVKIEYDSNDFVLTPIDIKQKQEIDYKNGNRWHWTIKAIAHKPVSSIRIIVDAVTPDGSLQKITPRKIDIAIEIDPQSAFRRGINYLIDHPEYTIPSILVPLVIFLFRRRKKETKVADEENS